MPDVSRNRKIFSETRTKFYSNDHNVKKVVKIAPVKRNVTNADRRIIEDHFNAPIEYPTRECIQEAPTKLAIQVVCHRYHDINVVHIHMGYKYEVLISSHDNRTIPRDYIPSIIPFPFDCKKHPEGVLFKEPQRDISIRPLFHVERQKDI